METKSLLIGIVSFITGALLVSIAATTFEKEELAAPSSVGMSQSNHALSDKTGDEFDKAFIAEMIIHHEGAVEMAKLAEKQAGHSEIKDLSQNIISAQENEITQMKQWQKSWGYSDSADQHSDTSPAGH